MFDSTQQMRVLSPPQHLFLYVAIRTEDDLLRLDDLLRRNALSILPPRDLDGVFGGEIRADFGDHVSSLSAGPQVGSGSLGSSGPASRPGRGPGAGGLLSFSERPDSVSRWRDHGYRHRGVCLRFTAARLPGAHATGDGRDDAACGARNLEHGADLYPVVSLTAAGEYETEWLWRIRGDRPTRIDASLIDGVVLGALMPDGLRDRVLGIVAERETPTSVYRARMDPDTVRLRVDDLPQAHAIG